MRHQRWKRSAPILYPEGASGVALTSNPRESELSAAFDAFRTSVRTAHRALEPRDAVARAPLQSRCSVSAFSPARRHLPIPGTGPWRGWPKRPLRKTDVSVAERVLRQETGDDREAQQRQATAATVVGGWLRNYRNELAPEIRRIQRAVTNLGFKAGGPPVTNQVPADDARFDALIARIKRAATPGWQVPE